MTIVFQTTRQLLTSGSRKYLRHIVLGLLLGSFATLSACQPEKPKMVGGLTGVVFNYDQTTYLFVSVNGKEIGRGLDSVKLGGYSGGGGMCCNAIPTGATEVQVTLTPVKGGPITITAPVEKWRPDLARYLVVHILPGKKVVASITAYFKDPRKDLLEQRQVELGLPKQIRFRFWTDGPEQYNDAPDFHKK